MNPADTPISQLDDILIRWHFWSASEKYGTGWAPESSYCRMYRTSRQYDDTNGSLDASIESRLMQGIDNVIQQFDRHTIVALSVDARNLATGCKVWVSQALPVDQEQLATLFAQARLDLQEALEGAGLW